MSDEAYEPDAGATPTEPIGEREGEPASESDGDGRSGVTAGEVTAGEPIGESGAEGEGESDGDGRSGVTAGEVTAGDYVVADAPGPSSAAGGGRRRRKVAMAVVGVIALLATGLAVSQLMAADGAESPEAAVRAFFDAVEDEDALGVLESLAPSERAVLVPSVHELSDQLTDLDVAGDDLDLQKVGGLDLRIEGLELRTQGLHPDVAAVKITGGTIETSAKFRDLPMGKVLDAAVQEQDGRDMDEPVEGSVPLDVTLATLKGDEGWHVSLLYSLAEAERVSDGDPVPDFGNSIPAKGADSPRAAADAMVAAFNEEDFDRMIELTPPDTMAVLHDYGPGLLVDDPDEADEADEDPARLEDVKLGEPEGSGGTRRLALEGYRFVDEETNIVYDGSCITFDFSGEVDEDEPSMDPQRECLDASEGSATDGSDGIGETVLIDSFGGASFLGPLLFRPGTAEVVVVERDGAWYVDPSRSIIDSVLGNLEQMPPDQVDRMVEYWVAVASGDDEADYGLYGPDFYEGCPGVEAPPEDATFEERKAAALRCEEAWSGDEDEPVDEQAAERLCQESSLDQAEVQVCLDGTGTITEEGNPTEVPLPEDACYESDDEAEVEACINALGDPEALQEFREIACYDGEDDAAIEACLLGLGDPTAVGEFHADACYDTDDDRAIEACLQDLVDKGELEPTVLFELRCSRVYDEVDDGDLATADDAFDQCLADATNEYNASKGGVPPPTTG